MSQLPPQPPMQQPMQPYPQQMVPHRGGAVLTLGILGLVVCVICGIIAWVMGNNDLRAMREGRMDPSGEGMTRAGKICGMIGTILACVAVVAYVLVLILAIGAGAHHSRF